MLQFFNRCSQGRGAWLLMALTALVLELVALYFQHVMLLQPCVMCIYERCALFGILGASLVGAIAPKTPLRYVAILLWIYSAWEGVQLAWKHTMIQLHPSPFNTRFRRLLRAPMAVPDAGNATVAGRHLRRLSAGGADCADRTICSPTSPRPVRPLIGRQTKNGAFRRRFFRVLRSNSEITPFQVCVRK